MNNFELKNKILSRIKSDISNGFLHVFKYAENDIRMLEAIPVNLSNEVTYICEDYADGVLEDKECIDRLIKFIKNVPN